MKFTMPMPEYAKNTDTWFANLRGLCCRIIFFFHRILVVIFLIWFIQIKSNWAVITFKSELWTRCPTLSYILISTVYNSLRGYSWCLLDHNNSKNLHKFITHCNWYGFFKSVLGLSTFVYMYLSIYFFLSLYCCIAVNDVCNDVNITVHIKVMSFLLPFICFPYHPQFINNKINAS